MGRCPNLVPGAPNLRYGMPPGVRHDNLRRVDPYDTRRVGHAGERVYVDEHGSMWHIVAPSEAAWQRPSCSQRRTVFL